ncbi:MAG: hypothetical protein J5767_13365 [Paludibacteraceae bacterium]|jgi:hypothetical protein|nr:hypothetical protein [Paludibacteraceae bacterium]
MAKTRIYNIKDELLHVFKIRTVPHNLDIDGMIEDMCMADDESHIRMIGLFLYRCLLHDKRCSDSFNIYWFTQIMLPFPENVSAYYRKQKLLFFQKISASQIRLMLFIVMTINKDEAKSDEVRDFFSYWTSRYNELVKT